MSESQSYKIAFIGSHGVGKTTLCYGLAAGLKARDVTLEVVREVARRSPLPINQSTSVSSQAWILHTQIAEELAADAQNGAVICDRSVLDNYVYMLVAAGPQIPLEPLVDYWMTTYDLLLHVPILAAPSADGIRALDPAFQRAVDNRLLSELKRRNLPVEYLNGDTRDGWLDTAVNRVLERLEPPQLQLL
jgi:nicotinamide riboside kinase